MVYCLYNYEFKEINSSGPLYFDWLHNNIFITLTVEVFLNYELSVLVIKDQSRPSSNLLG